MTDIMVLKKYFLLFPILFFLLFSLGVIFSSEYSSDLEGGLSIDLEVTNPPSEDIINNSLDLTNDAKIDNSDLNRDRHPDNFNSNPPVIQTDPLPKNKSETIPFSQTTLFNNNPKTPDFKAALLFYNDSFIILLLNNTLLLFILLLSILFLKKFN